MMSGVGLRRAVLVALAMFVAVIPSVEAQMTPDEWLLEEVDSFRSSEGKVKALLEDGADPELATEEGVPVLMVAAMSGNEPAVAELLAGGADVNRATDKGVTALMLAARNDKDEVVGQLLAAGAEKNALDEDGWSALMFAAYNNARSAVEALLAADVDTSVLGTDGWSAVHMAVEGGYSNLLNLLLEAGAELPPISAGDMPTLVRAARGGDSEVLLSVIEHHPDLEVRDVDGKTALIKAAAIGETEIVMELLRRGADTGARDAEERTALSHAEEHGFEEIQALLGGEVALKQPDAGDVLEIECDEMEGPVHATVRRRGDELELAVFYPKPVAYYMGGYESGTKELTANAHFYLDTDAKKKTGKEPEWGEPEQAQGTEYEVEFAEMRTSVTSGDNRRYVSRQVMYADIEREGEMLYDEDMGGYSPRAVRDLNRLSLNAPLEVLGLESGREIRTVFEVGFCPAVEGTMTLD